MSKEIPLSVQIGEVEREIRMRESVYPGLIQRDKLRAAAADRQLRIMREVLVTLQELREALLKAREAV